VILRGNTEPSGPCAQVGPDHKLGAIITGKTNCPEFLLNTKRTTTHHGLDGESMGPRGNGGHICWKSTVLGGNARTRSFGFPAMVIPFGMTPDGLPVGVQLFGRSWEEERSSMWLSVPGRRLDPFLCPSYDAAI
jgi:hypothetical protein